MAFQFRHILVRDAAYRSIPKVRRAELHEGVARWLDKRAAAMAGTVDQFVGFHLAEAVENRRAIGPHDATGGDLAREAAGRLAEAAEKLRFTDLAAVPRLFGRAASLTSGLEQLRYRYRQAEALVWTSEIRSARALFEAVTSGAEAAGDEELGLEAELSLLDLSTTLGTDLPVDYAEALARRGSERFRISRNLRGAINAVKVQLLAQVYKAQWSQIEPLSREQLRLGEEAGDLLAVDNARSQLLSVWMLGPTPAEEGLRLLDEMERDLSDPTILLPPLLVLTRGFLNALAGRGSTARALLGEAARLADELHNRAIQSHVAFATSFALLALDDAIGAQQSSLRAIALAEAVGDEGGLASLFPLLAETHLRTGELEEAQRFAERGREISLQQDLHAQGWWRAVLAKVEGKSGNGELALQLADAAVELVERSDGLYDQGFVHSARAYILELQGTVDEAITSYEVALERYERKGNLSAARNIRTSLEQLRHTEVSPRASRT